MAIREETKIRLDNIIPPDEKGQNQELINRLMQSIKEDGLLHQITLQGDSPPYKIIAGKKRFIACRNLDLKTIEAKIFPNSCPNPNEIVLKENLYRDNLPWYDQVELELELHNMRIAEHGEASRKGGRPAKDDQSWSQNDTARELGLALGTFSQDIQLAQALISNPHLRKVKDKTTALKLVKITAKQQIAELESLTPSTTEMDRALLGDSLDILKVFPDETFDACVTDPPWSQYKDEGIDQKELLPIFREVIRVLKRNSFLYIITSTADFNFYYTELSKLMRVQQYPIIWQKTKTITHGRAAWQYARDYEPILVAVKGNPVLSHGTEISSILKFDNVPSPKLVHPHEKPIELIQEIIKHCTFSGSKIVDPFAGSGVVGSAAKSLDRRYILIEKDRKFFKNIERRLEK